MDPGTLRRLAYAKRLHRLGESLLKEDIAIQNAQGIVMVDAVVETLLRTALAYKGKVIDKKERTFPQLVSQVQNSGIFAEKPPNYKQLLEIHDVRNLIQHDGIFPDFAHVAWLADYARANVPIIAVQGQCNQRAFQSRGVVLGREQFRGCCDLSRCVPRTR